MDEIFSALRRRKVEYLLFGGANFLLRHKPVLTLDVDIWIHDTPENRERCERALADLGAEWGPTEDTWGPVHDLPSGWLDRQALYALSTRAGALDVFRSVAGLADWMACRGHAEVRQTAAGESYISLSDDDMLACQYALDESLRKLDRIRYLERLKEGGRR